MMRKMMKELMRRFLPLSLCAAFLLLSLSGCGKEGGTRDLTKGQGLAAGSLQDEEEDPRDGTKDAPDATKDVPDGTKDSGADPASSALQDVALPAADAAAYTDLAVRLLQECADSGAEGNVLISPLSIVNALAMTANGARGETLSQMEQLFGADLGSLGDYLHAYNSQLPAGEKYKLHSANSIWIKDEESFTVSPDFLAVNTSLFGADIYAAPFDASTLKDINKWVSDNTDKMIPEILDEIPEDAVMYLINALTFDAEWQNIYKEYQIRDGVFTREDGTKQDVEMMYSTEYVYLQDEQAQGFIKYYNDAKYAFAALLPDEGVSLQDYIASLTGERLHGLLSDPLRTTEIQHEPQAPAELAEISVEAAIPKFEVEYDILLNSVLEEMGMRDAFDPRTADLSGIGTSPDGNLYISRVLHKTYIAVDEKGTKAGAATAVEVNLESAVMEPIQPKIVYLDRPFVYMIIDCEENLPVFIGTVTGL